MYLKETGLEIKTAKSNHIRVSCVPFVPLLLSPSSDYHTSMIIPNKCIYVLFDIKNLLEYFNSWAITDEVQINKNEHTSAKRKEAYEEEQYAL